MTRSDEEGRGEAGGRYALLKKTYERNTLKTSDHNGKKIMLDMYYDGWNG